MPVLTTLPCLLVFNAQSLEPTAQPVSHCSDWPQPTSPLTSRIVLCPLPGVKAAALAALRAAMSAFLASLASAVLLKASINRGWCRCTVLIFTLRPSSPLGGFFSHSLSWTTSCKEGDSHAQPGQKCRMGQELKQPFMMSALFPSCPCCTPPAQKGNKCPQPGPNQLGWMLLPCR